MTVNKTGTTATTPFSYRKPKAVDLCRGHGLGERFHSDGPKAESPRITVLPQQAEPQARNALWFEESQHTHRFLVNTRVRFAQFRYHQIVLAHFKLRALFLQSAVKFLEGGNPGKRQTLGHKAKAKTKQENGRYRHDNDHMTLRQPRRTTLSAHKAQNCTGMYMFRMQKQGTTSLDLWFLPSPSPKL